jgi:flagellar biosynthetic protein FliQ
MNLDTHITDLARELLLTTILLAGPVLLVGLVVGLVISVFQAVTQIQEQTLAFIPKVLGLVVVIIVAGPWMLGQILTWTTELYGSIPSLVGT